MDIDKVRLVDIGNTYAKILYHDKKVRVLAKEFDLDEEFYYINVNSSLKDRLEKNPKAKDISKYIRLKTSYKGLGVDRKVVCSYIDDGVIVDAGSAITVDVMSDSYHEGGFIMMGIEAMLKSYRDISPALGVKRVEVDIKKLPQNTTEAINFAIIKSIVSTVKDISKDKKIYFCGGDGLELSKYFENSIYKEDLVFDAMKKILKETSKDA